MYLLLKLYIFKLEYNAFSITPVFYIGNLVSIEWKRREYFIFINIFNKIYTSNYFEYFYLNFDINLF